MSRHTPGPWVVESLVDGYDIHAPQAGCFIATTSDPEMVWGAVTRKDDARLVAAAPELLEALEYYAEKVADLNRYGVMIETSLRELELDLGSKAEAAIAKAKGERRVLPSPQEPDSFTVGAARAAIAKAKGVE